MKLFKLTVNWNVVYPNSKANGHWDSYYGKIIRAKTETDARKLANETVGDEGHIWEDSTKVLCQIITSSGNPEIIMTDYLQG